MQQANMDYKPSQAVSYHAQLVWDAYHTDEAMAAVAACNIRLGNGCQSAMQYTAQVVSMEIIGQTIPDMLQECTCV